MIHSRKPLIAKFLLSIIFMLFFYGECTAVEDNSQAKLLQLLPNLAVNHQTTNVSQNPSSPSPAKVKQNTTGNQNNNVNPNTPNSTAPQTPQVSSHLWNLDNVDIRDVIQEVSRETGKNFIVDPRVQGKITMISSTPLSPAAVYQVFLSSLQVLGYSAIPSGKVIKIIPNAEAAQHISQLASMANPGTGDEMVVRIISVHNVNAEQLVPILRPLLPQSATISANMASNTIIVGGRATQVERIVEIVHRVDTTNVNGIDVIPLNYALAQDLVNSIQQLFSSNKTFAAPQSQATLAVDDRSNSILISGTPNQRLKIKVLISQLDTPNQQLGNTQVIYLHYLKAQDLAPILAGIAQSQYHGGVGVVIGQRTQTGMDYTATKNSSNESTQGDSTPSSTSSGSFNNQPTPPPPSAPAISPGSMSFAGLPNQNAGAASNAPPKVEIIAEPNTNSIILNAPPTLMRTMREVIAKLDTRPAQILVEALIAEVDLNTSAELGIQWGAFTQAGQTGTDSDDASAAFRAGIGIITGKGIHDLQGVITAIGKDQDSNILSTPSVVVLDNHQAKIEVGQEISVQDSSYPNNAGGTTTATPYATFGREKVALHLYVTPQIDQSKTLTLAIDQGNDTLQNPDNISTTPLINISSIKTSVLVSSGDILVLGGLTQNQVAKGNDRVPLLGDIPGIGQLFKVDKHSRNKKELLVFIRPIILYNDAQGIQVSSNKYGNIRETQLNWFRNEFYKPDYKSHVLPPYKKPKDLPPPFASNGYTQAH